MTFGDALKKYRTERGASQIELADELGFYDQFGQPDSTRISHYEHGDHGPNWKAIKKFARILGDDFIKVIVEALND